MGITVWRKIAFNCSSFTCNCLTFSLRRWLFSALCLFRIRKAVDFLLQLYLTQWINPFIFIFLFFFFFLLLLCLVIVMSKACVFFLPVFGRETLARQAVLLWPALASVLLRNPELVSERCSEWQESRWWPGRECVRFGWETISLQALGRERREAEAEGEVGREREREELE